MEQRYEEMNDEEFRRSLITAINEASPDGILVVDGNGVIASHNARLLKVLGINTADVPGARDGSLIGLPDQVLISQALNQVKAPNAFVERMKTLLAEPRAMDHSEVEFRDGRTLERHSSSLWGENGRYLGRVWFFRDITEHKRNEQRLLEMSHTDELTGIANRRHFFERAAEEFTRARRFERDLSFVMLDLDHFKNVNDRWGHSAGDRVLKQFCECVRSTIREVDLFARLGGEEFAILVPDTDADAALQLAERVRQKFALHSFTDDTDRFSLTVCAGVSTLHDDDSSAEVALKRADTALYEAKRSGRNRVVAETAVPGSAPLPFHPEKQVGQP